MERRSAAGERMERYRRRWPFLALAALFASSAPAWLDVREVSAAPALFVALTYDVDSVLGDCPSESDFRRAVQKQVGYDPFREGAAERVLVETRATERGIEGSIVWTDPSGKRKGERHFASVGRTCRSIALNLSFAVAVQIQMLDTLTAAGGAAPGASGTSASSAEPASTGSSSAPAPAASTGAPLPAPAPAPSAPIEAAKPEASSSAVDRSPAPAFARGREAKGLPHETSEPSPPPFRLFVGLGPQADLGVAPRVTAEGRLFFTARHAAWSAELGTAAGLPITDREDSGGGFRERVLLGTLGICGHFDPFALCGLGRAGQIRVEGFGVDVPESPSGFLVQAGVRLAAQQAMGVFAGGLHAEVLWTMTRPTVTLNEVGVWTMPAATFLVGFDAMGALVR